MLDAKVQMPGLFVLDVVTSEGIPFRVLLIRDPAAGPNTVRGRDRRWGATVEFHDLRFARPNAEHHPQFSIHGQFVGSFYVDTLLDRFPGSPLNLDAAVPGWSIDVDTMGMVTNWLRNMASHAN